MTRHRTIALTPEGYAAAEEIQRRDRAAVSGRTVRLGDLTTTHTGRRLDVAGLSGVLQGVIAVGDRVQLALVVGGARIWTDWLNADDIAETFREDHEA